MNKLGLEAEWELETVRGETSGEEPGMRRPGVLNPERTADCGVRSEEMEAAEAEKFDLAVAELAVVEGVEKTEDLVAEAGWIAYTERMGVDGGKICAVDGTVRTFIFYGSSQKVLYKIGDRTGLRAGESTEARAPTDCCPLDDPPATVPCDWSDSVPN